jgi:hypothetical protein
MLSELEVAAQDEPPTFDRGRCWRCKARYVLLYRGECRHCIADNAHTDTEPPVCRLMAEVLDGREA